MGESRKRKKLRMEEEGADTETRNGVGTFTVSSIDSFPVPSYSNQSLKWF